MAQTAKPAAHRNTPDGSRRTGGGGSKLEKEEIIIDLFRKRAEADGKIGGTDAYRRWLKSVRR